MIVTMNLRDFPERCLAHHAVEARHPDDFVLDLIETAPGAVASIVVEQAAALNPVVLEQQRCGYHLESLILQALRLSGFRLDLLAGASGLHSELELRLGLRLRV